jgi:MAP/microtubule affinity-regulating kinase
LAGRIEDYTIGEELGRGAYAAVKFGTHKQSKQQVAIKTYEKARLRDPQRKQSVKREMQILQKLQHPNIIRLHETLESSKQIYIVMEYVGKLSLQDYLKTTTLRRLQEPAGKSLFRQVVKGIEYCHRLHVAHRDIKLENILLDDKENVKVIDFGFSAVLSAESRTRAFCGTPNYMAPEIIMRRDYKAQPVDIWALGVLLYAMLTGKFPFKGSNNDELFRNICKGDFDIPEDISSEAKDLIRRMVVVDPRQRPTCTEVLKHLWLSEGPRVQDDSEALKALMKFGYSEDEIRSASTQSVVHVLFERLKIAMAP